MIHLLARVLPVALILAPLCARAETPAVTVGMGFEFSSGKYGTSTRTESVYAPLTVAVAPTERLGFSLEVPFLYQSNSSVTASVITGGGMMGASGHAAAMSGSGMMGSGGTAQTAASSSDVYGLGDVLLKGGYVLVPEGELMPRIRPYLQVKFPTAQHQTLGTGNFDEGGAVELSKRIGRTYSFAEVGYLHQGRSDRVRLKDYLSYSAGTGYAVGDRFLPMIIVKGATSPAEGASDLLEARLKLKYLLTPETGIELYGAKGFTTNSPDYGGGLSIFHDF
ncbi:hypothetical protein GMSM_33740 [Geomonas sp. Red276]